MGASYVVPQICARWSRHSRLNRGRIAAVSTSGVAAVAFERDGFDRVPADADAASRNKRVNPGDRAPVCDDLPNPVNLYVNIALLVSRLLRRSYPTAVARLITFIVVNSINAVQRRRRLTHVGKEIVERLPALTNSDAAPAVSVIVRIRRIFATTPHLAPSAVNLSAAKSVPLQPRCRGFRTKAPAGSDVARRKISPRAFDYFPAFTTTQPATALAGDYRHCGNDRQAAKGFFGQINKFCHKTEYDRINTTMQSVDVVSSYLYKIEGLV